MGRPKEDIRIIADHYGVSKQFIYNIGFNRFMSCTEPARQLYITMYRKRRKVNA